MNENMTNINDLFSKNLKKFRSMKYKTQKEFADVLDLPPTTYGQYENGKRQPEFTTLVQMAKLLNTSVDMLLTNSEHDMYLERVCNTIHDFVFKTETVEEMPDRETICNIYTSNGVITLAHIWYRELLDKIEDKIHHFISEEVREEIVSKRLALDNKAVTGQYTFEAKVLCESLHYDYKIVAETAEKIGSTYPEEEILNTIYEMYFLGIKGSEGVEEIVNEISRVNAAIQMARFRIQEYGENVVNLNKWPFEYLAIINKREIARNPIAELYLLKHWGLEEEKLKNLTEPFRAMRSHFYECGLLPYSQIEEKDDYSLLF